MGVYDAEIALAQEMIGESGQQVILRKMVDGAPGDADQPWKPGAATTEDTTVSMLFLPDEQRGREQFRLNFGTTVPEGNLIGYMPEQGVVPTLKDTIVRDGVDYAIRAIEPFAPNGELIYYMLRFTV